MNRARGLTPALAAWGRGGAGAAPLGPRLLHGSPRRERKSQKLGRQEGARPLDNLEGPWRTVGRLLGLGSQESIRNFNSERVFACCADQAALPQFLLALFGPAGPEEASFVSKHQLLMSHVWMVHRRLREEGKEAKLMQQALFDRLWEDTQRRIRFAGTPELSVNKHLSRVQKLSFVAALAYDDAIKTGSEDEMATAVWRAVFLESQEAEEEPVYAYAKYVLREVAALDALDLDDIYEGRVPWGQPPPLPEGVELPALQFGRDWRTALDDAGTIYYWNVRTREATYDPPSEEQQASPPLQLE